MSDWTAASLYRSREASIRVLTVSLVAVAAFVAGIYLTTRAQRQIHVGREKLIPAGEQTPAGFQLEKLRTAGL